MNLFTARKRRQVSPPGPGTPPRDQVHPQTKYTPLGPGTPPKPGTPPSGPGTPPGQGTPPRTRYNPPKTRYTPGTRYTHHGSTACWEIRATSGRYASYWNAFLFLTYFRGVGHCPVDSSGSGSGSPNHIKMNVFLKSKIHYTILAILVLDVAKLDEID